MRAAGGLLCALFVSISPRANAQSAERISDIKRVALDWAESGKSLTAVKGRVVALQHELSFGAVRNRSGEYVKADLDSVTAAAKAAGPLKEHEFQTSITDAVGKHTYPISTFTWVLIPGEAKNGKKQEALREMVRWMLTNGQKQCQSLGYAPLPEDLAEGELRALAGEK
jgi:hypothetical protein